MWAGGSLWYIIFSFLFSLHHQCVPIPSGSCQLCWLLLFCQLSPCSPVTVSLWTTGRTAWMSASVLVHHMQMCEVFGVFRRGYKLVTQQCVCMCVCLFYCICERERESRRWLHQSERWVGSVSVTASSAAHIKHIKHWAKLLINQPRGMTASSAIGTIHPRMPRAVWAPGNIPLPQITPW